jgi:hypothetical protein
LRKVVPGATGKLMARQMLLFGLLLPCLAGLDSDRQALYLDLCAGIFLAFITWQLVSQFIRPPEVQAAPA